MMKNFILDTNAMIIFSEEEISFYSFNNVYITNWCEKELINFFINSNEFHSYDIRKQEKELKKRQDLLDKISKKNIISPKPSWHKEITDAFNRPGSNLSKETGINDVVLIALSNSKEGKKYIFVSNDQKCINEISKNGCNTMNFSEFKNENIKLRNNDSTLKTNQQIN